MPAPRFISPPATPPPSKGLSLATGGVADLETRRLIGTTRFEPRNDVKNILITGGAGFM